jgi:RNA polymerase primary sigma factor
MHDRVESLNQSSANQRIEGALEILIGDHERTGRLLPEDLARLASKRDLTAEEIDEIANRLRERGIEFQDEDVPGGFADEEIPDDFVMNSWGDAGLSIPNLPLLTAEEEKKLGHACRTADKLLATTTRPFSQAVTQMIADGDNARTSLIVHNLRLVAWVANRFKWTRLDFGDLFQEGMFGLMRAVERFDPTLGYKFSTYAVWWIEQAIRRGIDNTGGTIRIPVHRLETIRKYRRMVQRLRAEFGVEPSLQKLATALEWPLEQTAYIRDLSMLGIVSIDEPISEDGRTTLKDVIPDDLEPSPERVLIQQQIHELVEKAISGLPAREGRILRLRFGIGANSDHTLEAIGQQYGVTRERIRQIEAKALRRLQHPSRSGRLRTFLE